MQEFLRENEDGQAVYSELQLSEMVKKESEDYISETKYKINENKLLLKEIIKETNKLKNDNLELRSKCSNLRTQKSCISKDILEMRTVAEKVNDVLETASKSAYMTSCEEEEYKNIIEKLEIKTIFIDNTLRESSKALEEELKQKTDKVMYEKSINIQNIRKVKEECALIYGKVKEIDEKINELTKNKNINNKECDNTEEKLIKIRNENNQLQDCYDNKIKHKHQITKQIQEEEKQYQIELAKIKESIEQLEISKTLKEKEIVDLNEKCVELSKQNCEKQIKIEELVEEHTKLQTKFEELINMKQELEETMQKNIAILKNEASIYSQDMQEKEANLEQLKEYSLKIEQDQLVFRTQLEVQISESIKMEKELSILQCENQQTEEEIKEMITENEQLTLKISDMEKEIDRLKNCMATVKEETSSFKKQLEEKQKIFTEKMSDYSSKIKEVLEILDSKKAEEDQNISNYMKEFEKITKQHAEAMAEYENLNEKIIAKNEELEDELKLTDEEYRAVSEENERLRKEKTEISSADVQSVPSPSYTDNTDNDFYKLLLVPKKRKFDECSDSSSINTDTIRADELKKYYASKQKTTRGQGIAKKKGRK